MVGKWLNSIFRRKVNSDRSQKLRLITCQIHGSHYYNCLSLVQSDNIHKNDRLHLVREPSNQYDKYAIEVLNGDKIKLGYVPKNHNRVIAELMDQGCNVYATVERVSPEHWEPVSIHIELRI